VESSNFTFLLKTNQQFISSVMTLKR